jgi:PAS domain-containing protein
VSGRLRLAPFPTHAQAVHDLLRTCTSAGLELDTAGIIRVTEAGIASLLGYPPEELHGRPLVDLVFAEDVGLVTDLLANNSPATPSVEVRFNRRQRTRPVALEISMVSGSSGTRVHMQDVLSWRVVELALRGHSRLGHAMVDNTPSLILRLDQQCRAIQANAAWVEVSGIDQTAETGLVWMRALDERTLEAFRDALPSLCSGKSFATTAYIRHTGGYISRFEFAVAPVVEDQRSFAGFVVVGCDLGPLSDTELVAVAATVRFASESTNNLVNPTAEASGVTAATQPTELATQPTPGPNASHGFVSAQPLLAHRPTEPVAANPDPMMKMALASVLAAARTNYVPPRRSAAKPVPTIATHEAGAQRIAALAHLEAMDSPTSTDLPPLSTDLATSTPPAMVWQPATPKEFLSETTAAPELPTAAELTPETPTGDAQRNLEALAALHESTVPPVSALPRGMAEYQTALAATEAARRTAQLAEAERIAATERSQTEQHKLRAAQSDLDRLEAEHLDMETRLDEARAQAEAEAARVENARALARRDSEIEQLRLQSARTAREQAEANAALALESEKRAIEIARQAAQAAELTKEHPPVDDDLGSGKESLEILEGVFATPTRPSVLPPAFVDSRVRTGILEHLEGYHEDGMDNVISVGLLFIDVLTTGSQKVEDRRYDLKILERRLRTAVREHEFAAPLGDQGFVVAARGTLGDGDLEALVARLVARLTMPLRGHGGTASAPQVCVGGVRSDQNDSDVELVLRAELARARALAGGAGSVVLS